LRRADIIIALQENERFYFENLSGKKSICFYSFPEVNHVPSKIFEKKLLYFASSNVINVRALEYFVEEILPIVKQKHPDVLLLVGGSICNAIPKKEEHFKCLGLIDNPVDFYKQGDIVINPELEGSGLKIKTIEALCYGLPVVTTRVGASGATGLNNEHLMIAETSHDFANALIELIEDDTLRNNIKTRALKWVNVNKEKMKKELKENLPAK
jgi:glycosyltransferase involved in cell wall biosynthesis